MVNPKLLCRQHLLGEHRELHTLAGTLLHGKSIYGYIVTGLVDPSLIKQRHAELVTEMERRGYNHQSPIWQPAYPALEPCVDMEGNLRELRRRCSACKERQSKWTV